MKSSEFHKMILKQGWQLLRVESTSHYIYVKNGKTYSVPFHGSKEIGKGLACKIIKEMNLKK